MKKTASGLSRFTHRNTASRKPALSTEHWVDPGLGTERVRSNQSLLYW